ncbi:unnamed protein product [Pylaiella littoralis]
MVYRKPEYQKLKRQIEMLVKEIEKKKLEPLGAEGEDRRKKSQRVVGRLEKDLANATKELQALAVSSKLVVTAMVMLVMFMVNKSFAGIVVAKLPFVPYSLVQMVSHRMLEGEDPTDCSVAFIFALCQAGVKGNITKLVGVGQPKVKWREWEAGLQGDDDDEIPVVAQPCTFHLFTAAAVETRGDPCSLRLYSTSSRCRCRWQSPSRHET